MDLAAVVTEAEPYAFGAAIRVELVLRAGDAPGERTLRLDDLPVTVLDAAGRPAPAQRRRGGGWGCDGVSVALAPGDEARVTFDAARYAWLEHPGRYTVRVAWPPEDPERFVSAAFALSPTDPGDLEAVLVTHTESPFHALGHARFVPLLEQEAVAGVAVERALGGLGACPCAEASDALLRWFDRTDDPDLRARVAEELLSRAFPTRVDDVWFASRAWAPRFDAELLARARAPSWPMRGTIGCCASRPASSASAAPPRTCRSSRARTTGSRARAVSPRAS